MGLDGNSREPGAKHVHFCVEDFQNLRELAERHISKLIGASSLDPTDLPVPIAELTPRDIASISTLEKNKAKFQYHTACRLVSDVDQSRSIPLPESPRDSRDWRVDHLIDGDLEAGNLGTAGPCWHELETERAYVEAQRVVYVEAERIVDLFLRPLYQLPKTSESIRSAEQLLSSPFDEIFKFKELDIRRKRLAGRPFPEQVSSAALDGFYGGAEAAIAEVKNCLKDVCSSGSPRSRWRRTLRRFIRGEEEANRREIYDQITNALDAIRAKHRDVNAEASASRIEAAKLLNEVHETRLKVEMIDALQAISTAGWRTAFASPLGRRLARKCNLTAEPDAYQLDLLVSTVLEGSKGARIDWDEITHSIGAVRPTIKTQRSSTPNLEPR